MSSKCEQPIDTNTKTSLPFVRESATTSENLDENVEDANDYIEPDKFPLRFHSIVKEFRPISIDSTIDSMMAYTQSQKYIPNEKAAIKLKKNGYKVRNKKTASALTSKKNCSVFLICFSTWGKYLRTFF